MRLAGFYKAPLVIKLEEDIAEIAITDEDTTIKGRIDILAIKKNTLSDWGSLLDFGRRSEK